MLPRSILGVPVTACVVGFVLHLSLPGDWDLSTGSANRDSWKILLLRLNISCVQIRPLQKSVTTCGRSTAREILKARASWSMSLGVKCTWDCLIREKKNWRHLQKILFQLSLRNQKVKSMASFYTYKTQFLLLFLMLLYVGCSDLFALSTSAVPLREDIKKEHCSF